MNIQMSKETVKSYQKQRRQQDGELVVEACFREKSGLEKEENMKYNKASLPKMETVPDVVINLPDGKKMIVDSKIIIDSYEKYINEEDDDVKINYLKEHVNSIKRHVEQLNKNYQDLYQIESPDFVLLFIPIEPAFAMALNRRHHFVQQGVRKKYCIVTPATLLDLAHY
jgi:DNA recombination protein RmuC